MSDDFIPLNQSTPVQNSWQRRNQNQNSSQQNRHQNNYQRRRGHYNNRWGNNSTRNSFGVSYCLYIIYMIIKMHLKC